MGLKDIDDDNNQQNKDNKPEDDPIDDYDSALFPSYEISCNITPLKSYNYFDMYVELYDSNNTLIDKSFVWNMADPPENQPISIQETCYISDNIQPPHAIVYMYDSALHDDEPVYNATINMTN